MGGLTRCRREFLFNGVASPSCCTTIGSIAVDGNPTFPTTGATVCDVIHRIPDQLVFAEE
jgi:hypothetical protein